MTAYNWYTSFFLLVKRCRNDFLPWLTCQLVRCASHIKRNTAVETTAIQCSTLLKFVRTRERELIFQYVVLWKKTVLKLRFCYDEKQCTLYLLGQRVFMAAAGPRVRDLCVWSLALLEATAVLHQQDQKYQCYRPAGLITQHPRSVESHSPGTEMLPGCEAVLEVQTKHIKRRKRANTRGRHVPA